MQIGFHLKWVRKKVFCSLRFLFKLIHIGRMDSWGLQKYWSFGTKDVSGNSLLTFHIVFIYMVEMILPQRDFC